ncbi:mercuric reductase [Capsulimonas corticalis]|uniref:Mercuric reductase n=1 Tax=Capsulimonas corticalis TaxID=2219043 RepID=A0A402CUH0_9BACT|nr:FAD-dependent oxidoreductase [Capsulimonas corticalis]BDI28972.1 mercuric reductase [Capsulimonas corticalis]
MTDIEDYENVVIGSGEAGKYLAWTLAPSGAKTIVVERSMIGGSCPNVACLPSKNVIHSAKVASFFRRASEFGIETGEWRVNMEGVRRRKRKMVDELIAIHENRYHSSGAEFLMGSARFVGPRTFEVALRDGGTRVLRGEKVFLNLGTRSALPGIPGLAEAKPLSHVEALELDVVPERLMIIGGGYIGLEFAQAFRRFGAEVTVIHRDERLLAGEDPEVSAGLLEILQGEGIRFEFSSSATRVEGVSGESVRVSITGASEESVVEGTHVLVATGRTPNTESIDAAAGGVALDGRGYIQVDERLQTTADGVWAMGDCAGSPLFTHISFDDFRIVKDQLAGGSRTTTGRSVPWTLFTDPELARVGLNETEARARGISYRLAKLPMAGVLRARTLDERQGFMKALIGEDDRILGFTALGVNAGEILSMVQIAMLGNLPYTALRDAVLTHPTLSEGLVFLFMTVPAK